jgi:hypothetical protein
MKRLICVLMVMIVGGAASTNAQNRIEFANPGAAAAKGIADAQRQQAEMDRIRAETARLKAETDAIQRQAAAATPPAPAPAPDAVSQDAIIQTLVNAVLQLSDRVDRLERVALVLAQRTDPQGSK